MAESARRRVAVEDGQRHRCRDAPEAQLGKCEVYLCGPPPMVDAALAFLEAHGVPHDQVFHDKFTSPAVEPSDPSQNCITDGVD